MPSTRKNILVSFADGAFSNRKDQFMREAENLDLFDTIHCYNLNDLSDDFKTKHTPFISTQSRGFGYWIWKPLVVRMGLDLAGADDLVTYIDAGFTLNNGGRYRFLEYLAIAHESEFKTLSFQNIHTEYLWTKGDLAERLGVSLSSKHMLTSQLSSGFIILGKTDSNLDLVKQWYEISVEDGYRYIDDSPSESPNHPYFKEHRHDQSIFSLLRKLRGTTITHYEVQSYDLFFKNLKPFLPAWATGRRQ